MNGPTNRPMDLLWTALDLLWTGLERIGPHWTYFGPVWTYGPTLIWLNCYVKEDTALHIKIRYN